MRRLSGVGDRSSRKVTICCGSRTGSDFSNSALSSEKMAVLAPMPRVSESRAATVMAGVRRHCRNASRRSGTMFLTRPSGGAQRCIGYGRGFRFGSFRRKSYRIGGRIPHRHTSAIRDGDALAVGAHRKGSIQRGVQHIAEIRAHPAEPVGVAAVEHLEGVAQELVDQDAAAARGDPDRAFPVFELPAGAVPPAIPWARCRPRSAADRRARSGASCRR